MEDKIIASINKKIEKDNVVLILENFHMVKISDKIRDALEAHKETLTSLSLAYCRLFSLTNFPKLLKLRSLNLNDNKLKDGDIAHLTDFKNIKYLSFGGNQIINVDVFEQLKANTKMKMIDLVGNPCATNPSYRSKLFKIFPSLELVDYQNSNGDEIDSYEQSDDTESEAEEEEENDDFIDQNDNDQNESNSKLGEDEENIDNGDESDSNGEGSSSDSKNKDDEHLLENDCKNEKSEKNIKGLEKMINQENEVINNCTIKSLSKCDEFLKEKGDFNHIEQHDKSTAKNDFIKDNGAKGTDRKRIPDSNLDDPEREMKRYPNH